MTKFFPVRYWWTDAAGEHSASSVASGQTAEQALARFRAENPHLAGRCAVIAKPTKTYKP